MVAQTLHPSPNYSVFIAKTVTVVVERLNTLATGLGAPLAMVDIETTPLYQKLLWLAQVAELRHSARSVEVVRAQYTVQDVRARADDVLNSLAQTLYGSASVIPLAFMRSPVGVMISDAVAATYMSEEIFAPVDASNLLHCDPDTLLRLHQERLLMTWFPNGVRSYLIDDLMAIKDTWRQRPSPYESRKV